MSRRRVHLRIRGLVQGVSFRASARVEAVRLGLSGWVRNVPTGDVEAVAEGEAPSIDAFIAWCKHGPSEADVESVAVSDEPAQGETAPFQVLR